MNGQPPCPADQAPGPEPDTPPPWRCARFQAPTGWLCIDFISDLHLDATRPRTMQAFAAYLQATPASALMILGDLFEVWVGDDMRHEPFEATCTQVLAQAGQRLWLGLMAGNRDFLLGPDMQRACHAHLLPDPLLLDAFGQLHVLTHGDAWCLADTDYLAFRHMVRTDAWQQAFLSQPLPQRLSTARGIRAQSEARKHGPDMVTWADVDAPHAAGYLREAGSLSLIHGHTHRPSSEPFALPSAQRHVLSDWDLDEGHGPPRAEVLRLSARGLERLTLAQAMAPLSPR